jgi:23S rRNA (cytidine1920-2'-O)/16S rRNA (cytidine1409-2'-O)-methyltransferase
MSRVRADTLLVDRGLAESRERARALILAGAVRAGSDPVRKAAQLLPEAAVLSVAVRPRFVSRGGEKLEAALGRFALDVRGRVCADLGASTGGFTDCLLQRGAAKVYAIDAGYGQLADSLRRDPRVVVMERTNARALTALPEPIDLVTIDVSFIGLEKVLPAAAVVAKPGAPIVALVKPQFQGRRDQVGRGGLVKDPLVHAAIVGRLAGWAVRNGFEIGGLIRSPLTGGAGNREFLLLLRHVAS